MSHLNCYAPEQGEPMRAALLRHDPTRSVLSAFIQEIRPGRVMASSNDSVDVGSLPIDSVVNIEVGSEIWLAEIIGRVCHGHRQHVVADVRYRLPRNYREPGFAGPINLQSRPVQS